MNVPEVYSYDDHEKARIPTREMASKALVMEAINRFADDLPIGTKVKVEKIYHATRGYEPGKPRSGEVTESTYAHLVEHGAWHDPKTGKAKAPKWASANPSKHGRRG